MNRNVGKFDRIARLISVAILAVLVFTGVLDGALAIVALVVAVVLFVTALVGFCPAYRLLGLSTCGARQ